MYSKKGQVRGRGVCALTSCKQFKYFKSPQTVTIIFKHIHINKFHKAWIHLPYSVSMHSGIYTFYKNKHVENRYIYHT